jgi:D-galactarolactone cycloisomerase
VDDIAADGWKLDAEGLLPIPEAPGLSLELDADAVSKYSGG